MSDCIVVTNLRIPMHIGVTEEERASTQKIHVSLKLYTDTSRAGASDDIQDTIDYGEVISLVQAISKDHRNTLECFAEDISSTILQHTTCTALKVSVWKEGIFPHTEKVGISIQRER